MDGVPCLFAAIGLQVLVAATLTESVTGKRLHPNLQAHEWPIIFTRKEEGTPAFDIVEEPIPAECNVQLNTDFDGSAIRWGHRPAPPVKSAAECCRMCMEWLPRLGKTCDAWVCS